VLQIVDLGLTDMLLERVGLYHTFNVQEGVDFRLVVAFLDVLHRVQIRLQLLRPQRELEGRHIDIRFTPDGAAHFLAKLPADVEAETGAVWVERHGFLDHAERLEQLRLVFFGYPRTGVGYLNYQFLSRLIVRRLDTYDAAFGRKLDGITNQVYEHLLDLGHVGLDLLLYRANDLDEHVLHVGHLLKEVGNFVQSFGEHEELFVDGFVLVTLDARKVEDVINIELDKLDATHDSIEQLRFI